jgi:hypothetical protein
MATATDVGAPDDAAAVQRPVLHAALVTAFAGLSALALNGPQPLSAVSPLAAARLAPWDAELQLRAAGALIAADAPGEAGAYAQRSVAAMPLNQAGLNLLSAFQPPAAGLRSLNLAAALGWRDRATQVRLVEAALAESQPAVAAERIDALGRIMGAEVAGPFADQLLRQPGGTASLAVRAGYHMGYGWMPLWLMQPARSADVAAQRTAFIAAVEADDADWKRSLVEGAVIGFGAAKQSIASYDLWRASQANSALFAGPVYDPGFTQPIAKAPLGGEWIVSAEAAMAVEPQVGGGVSLTPLGQTAGLVLGQVIAASPQLRLAADWRGPRATVENLRLELSCLDGSGAATATRSLSPRGEGWHDVWSFTGLPQQCRLAALGLSLHRAAEDAAPVTLGRIGPG